MEYLLGFALCFGVPIWLVLRSLAAAKQHRAIEEYAWSLQNWEYDDGDYTFRVHFPTMVAQSRFVSSSYPLPEEVRDYRIKRKIDGRWYRKLTEESRRAELAALADPIRRVGVSPTRLRTIERGRWERIGEHVTPELETAYQRYVHRA